VHSSFSPNALPDPLRSPVELLDDGRSWLVTFSDLVLQLFAFLLIGLVITRAAGGDEPRPAAAPAVASARRDAAMQEADVVAMAIAAERVLPHPAAPARRAAAPQAAEAPADARPEPVPPAASSAPAEPLRAEAIAPIENATAAPAADASSPPAARPQAATPERLQAMGRYLAALVAGVAAGNAPEVTVRADEVMITLGDGIGFESGESELSAPARSVLAELRAIAQSMPDAAIEVSGHTDDRPIRTARFPSNLELSLARAAAVAAVIGDGDAELGRRIFASGYADRRPRASNRDDAGRAANRRVEIRLLALG
jgi:chemotaxis protein MotB